MARDHTSAVIHLADDWLMSLIDAETGQRGYALTGAETFLQPYLAVKDTIAEKTDNLIRLTQDPGAKDLLKTLAPVVNEKMAELAFVVELRRAGDAKAVAARVSEGQGKRLMDQIRSGMASFAVIEQDLLATHNKEFEAGMGTLFLLIAGTSLLALLFAFSFAYFVLRETQFRLRTSALAESERQLTVQENLTEQLSVTLRSIGDAVLTTDAEGRVTLLNPLAETLTGWSQDQAVGRQVDDVFVIINQDTRLPVAIPVREVLAKGTIQGLANHTVLLARNGSGECPIADSCAPIRDSRGAVIGSVLVFRDVSREYADQLALRNNAAIIQAILDTVPDGILTVVAADGRIVTANPAARAIFGFGAREMEGLGMAQILPGLDWGRTKEGAKFPVEMATSEMWLDGELHLTCIVRDISARREIESGLEKSHEELRVVSAELKRAAEAKSTFLANMSHELRTPLNSINGFSEVLSDETFGPLNPKQRKYVANVLTSGKHLLLLINQILDVARIESGKMTLQRTTVSLNSLLSEILELVSDMVDKKGLQLSVEGIDELPDLHIDELKIKQVVYNLLSNAVKFTPNGGNIGLRAKKTARNVEVFVWDTGVGIADENMEKIFEGFFRVDTPYSRVTEGTGLGLPLSRKMVELHGGKLTVESRGLGLGTSVKFTLPFEPAEKS